MEKERQKPYQERCQRLLNEMLKDEDNKYCVDCDAKGPRWASWNLGIFLCIRCAGIHRNLGVHISKVKSVNLDSWTPQQVVSLQQMGNSRARAVYEANLPDNFRRPQTENSLEAFIRAKYEQKKYIAREWVAPQLPKVNWDKELEEEAQRYRKKKREIKQTLLPSPINVATSVSPTSSVPKPLPKPQTLQSSPRGSRVSPSHSTDLLELDTPTKEVPANKNSLSDSDLLTNFLNSDNINTNNASSTKTNRTAEEENFFNQSSTNTKNDKKLTKDSILALYGNPVTYTSTLGMQAQSFSGHLNGTANVYPTQSNSPNSASVGRFVPQGSALGFNPFYTMAVAQSSQNGSNVVGNIDGNTTNEQLQQKMFSMNLKDRNAMQGQKQEQPSTQQINAFSSTLTAANLFH